jgi:glycine cleavage system H protein
MQQSWFTKDHEYLRVEGEVGTVGVTDYAQKQLGDVVFVELPEKGRRVDKGAQVAVVESVKAASEVFAPATGEVVEVNLELEQNPGRVNEDPLGGGWFFKLRLGAGADLSGLMDESAYAAFVASLDH